MKLFSRGAPNGRKAFERLPLADRVITFYAEDAGSWPHFAPIVTALTRELGRTVCYLTSSDADPVLREPPPGVHPFSIGDGVGRAFLFKMLEAGVVVATVPQLGISVLPRSRHAAGLGMQYLYVFHSMMSTHMIYEPDGFDHYDTVLCVGPYMQAEIRARERVAGLAPKELVNHGYGRLDTIVADRVAQGDARVRATGAKPTVVVAPSWGPTCIFETIGIQVVQALLDAGCRVIARPHPMTAKQTPGAVGVLASTFAGHEDFEFDQDIAGAQSLHDADVMVSDWSGAALEYAFGLVRPVVFIDVERKVNNPEYDALGIEPFEVSVREQIGAVVAPDALHLLAPTVVAMVDEAADWRDRIRAARDANIANLGSSGRVAAELIAAKADVFEHRNGLR